MKDTIMSIQIIPSVNPSKNKYDFVDAAIKVIEEAGIKYEVHPLETTMEGELQDLLQVIQKMNDKLVNMGAESIISQVKIYHNPSGVSSCRLTEKYR